ncbi:MAG: leucine-rich repeat protein [Candidatus Cloacimonetes bacterium]|nr:leucine-rich repeat protein [Candidatus Cloacimonadota bacterium]
MQNYFELTNELAEKCLQNPCNSMNNASWRNEKCEKIKTIFSKFRHYYVFFLILFLLCFGNLIAQGTPGLAYYLINNNTAYEVFRGSADEPHINIPETHNGLPVSRIGDQGFSNFPTMISITIPNSITSIGMMAFFNSAGLTSVTIPNGVTSIEPQVFYGCTNLTSVSIPEGVTSIGVGAFTNCTSLTSIDIPNSVTSIGMFAFQECIGLTSLSIGSGVTSIGNNAFVTVVDGLPIPLPAVTHFFVDSNIAVGLFRNDYYYYISLESVIIGNSVTSIGNFAFQHCINLSTVVIGDNVTSIGDYAFNNCNLTEIIIPNSVTNIGHGAFGNCTNLSSVTIGNGITNLGSLIFLNTQVTTFSVDSDIAVGLFAASVGATNTTLSSVTIGNSVTSIGDRAFYECTNLSSVSIGNNVTSIGWQAFFNNTSLSSITIPDNVVSIGNQAFLYCTQLSSVNFGNGLTHIGDQAFLLCMSLTSINLPNSLLSIGDSAFSSCTALNSVTIGNGLTNLGSLIFSGTSVSTFSVDSDIAVNLFAGSGGIPNGTLTTVILGSNITSIMDYAFLNCINLTSISFPSTITSIGVGAFYDCSSLNTLLIPIDVTIVGSNAVYGCHNITIYAEAPNLPEGWDPNWNPHNRPVLWGYAILPPLGLEIDILGNDVILYWQVPPSSLLVEGYNVYRGDDLLTSTPVSELTFQAVNTPSGMHVFGVKAVYAEGESEAVETVAYVGFNPPMELITTGGIGNILLSWTAPVIQPTVFLSGYKVEKRIGNGGWEVAIDNLPITPVSWTDTSVISGILYEYRVFAKYINPEYESEPSNLSSAIPIALPEFNIDPASHDFGSLVVGEISEMQTFTITNTGGSLLIVESISDCQSDDFIADGINTIPTELAPNEFMTFTITFSPLTAGTKTDQISITHSASQTPFIVTLSGVGIGLPEFIIDPESHDFGSLVVGEFSEIQTFTITNIGGSLLIVESISDCQSDDFIADGINTLPTELAPNESMTFTITFSPLTAGIKTDQISIIHSASQTSFIVTLSGVALGLPVFNIDPESHDFGSLVVGEISEIQTFTITNTGGSLLIVESISDCQSDDFIADGINTLPTELAPNESMTFTITFSPLTAGIKTDQISITHSASQTPFIVTLSGVGLGLPVFNIDPESHDFGSVVVGESSAPCIFTVTNTGGSPLVVNTIDLTGVNHDEFNVSASGLPWTIEANETRSFTVSFTPSEPDGPKMANLNITHNASDSPHTTTTLIGDSVVSDSDVVIVVTALHGNYPNPFNPETAIRFSLSNSGHVRMDIFNIRGSLVRTLVDNEMNQGSHTVVWNGKDNNGQQVSSGIYFYQMRIGDYLSIKRMVLMK